MAEIETAVNRVSPELRGAAPFLPEEALDLPEALAAFTIGSAWVNHLDHLTGTIEVGKLADLAVLDRDIFGPDAGPIGDTRVLLTLIEGEAVHEDRALEGARRPLRASPLAGVPFLLKDLGAALAGTRQTRGSRAFRDHVSDADTELARRHRRAGLIVLGKTNTPEFGNHSTTEPALFGPTRNPWDLGRTSGGSSGGSAAAVASGMVPAAPGNDGAGSIRIPSSCCGLFGLKPTRGRNSWAPARDAMAGIAVEHALTRSVRYSAAILDATSGPVPGDPYLAPPPSRPFL